MKSFIPATPEEELAGNLNAPAAKLSALEEAHRIHAVPALPARSEISIAAAVEINRRAIAYVMKERVRTGESYDEALKRILADPFTPAAYRKSLREAHRQ